MAFHYSRRGFLAGMSTLALQATARTEPELILYNGNLLTVDESAPRAQAAAVAGGPQQRVTVEEALRVGTINGAYASFEGHQKGSITAGKLADLMVLGRDPLRVDPMELIDIPVERTMVGGRWMFES